MINKQQNEEKLDGPLLWQLRIESVPDFTPYFDFLEPKALSLSTYEVLEGKDLEVELWGIECLFSQKPNLQELSQSIYLIAGTSDHPLPQVLLEEVKHENWLEIVAQSFQPKEIGPFYIFQESDAIIPSHTIPLQITAATAFGSGEHETTEGCLSLISRVKNYINPTNALDLGCGSGILGIGISKLYNIPVLLADCDPESVKVSQFNAKRNHCTKNIDFLESFGFANIHPCQYDLITANILAKPLISLSKDMATYTNPNSMIILSGLLERQKEEVLLSYLPNFKIVEEKNINSWVSLLLSRN